MAREPEKRMHVLIVEDDPGVSRLQQRRLEKAGHGATVVSTALEGLRCVQKGGFDLLILDQNLPGSVSGLDLYRQIKATGFAVPAILVTGVANEGVILEALRAGFVDFVPKTADFLDYLQITVDRVAKAWQTEKRLAESEALSESVVASAFDAVLTVDDQGQIGLSNPAAERVFQCDCDDLIHRAVQTILPDWPVGCELTQRLADRASPWETHGRRGDGELFPVEVSVASSEANDRQFWTVVARDVSERRKAQEERETLLQEQAARREAEMARAAIEAEAQEKARLYQELREIDSRKDEFLAMLAHELRNPLAAIRTVLQVVRVGGREHPTAIEQNWPILERQVDHLVRLVDDLLDVSRISRGKIILRKERVDLATVFERALENSRPLIDSRKHTLTVSLPAEPLPLDADAVRLVQVFSNLLNNSAKYTPEGGHIEFSARRENNSVEVRVSDNGVGIPPHMLPHIFDLFAQLKLTLDRAEGGMGIGLTLVRELTRLHGGEVEVSSGGSRRGTQFAIRLPLAWGLSPAPPAYPPKPASPAQSTGGHKPRSILFVDDNTDAARTMAQLLELLGHRVTTAGSGAQALAVLDQFHPEIAILDIGLPGMDGYELARKLRSDGRFKRLVLIALTGYGSPEDRRRSKEAGFDVHLVKPVDLSALEEVLIAPNGWEAPE
jgi:PAS domain S-box-containing protein